MPGLLSDNRQYWVLSSGREVRVDSFVQWRVYASLLEGWPTRQMNESVIADAVADAQKRFGSAPHVIQPQQRALQSAWRHPLGHDYAALPSVGCMVDLFSSRPARNARNACSGLTVIWFQEDYAYPLSPEAELVLYALDWERLASDGDY